jgi:hypothetical protein
LPALVTVAATTATVLLPVPAAQAVEPDDDPLQVTIDWLSPSEVPERGKVTLRGRVTNVGDEPWRAVKVYAFLGDTPMTSAEELAAAASVPSEVDVGDRIIAPGTFDDLGTLEPGETAEYLIRLRQEEVPVDAPGVYWFGAHALGNTDEARDPVADGRARTFLPLLTDAERPVDTSLVIQLRHPVRHTRDGRIRGVDDWAEDLGRGGSLHTLIGLGAAAGSRPLTWLVDPAVPDAVQRVVDGNPPRAMVEVVPGRAAQDGSTGPGRTPGSRPEDDASAPVGAEGQQADPSAEPAEQWLGRLEEALAGHRVMALPYGDPDVSAAADHGPELLTEARDRSVDTLEALGVSPVAAVAPPEGYLSPEALEQLPDDTLTLFSDRMLPAGVEGTVFHHRGRRVLTTSSGAIEGGPGPDDPLGTVAVRQRILAEAAVRAVAERPSPLVVVLPQGWVPQRRRAFFAGLDLDWVDLADPAALTSSSPLDADSLDYPPEQRAAELPAANFAATEAFVDAGTTLATVISRDAELDERVLVEALTSVSYANRAAADAVRARTEASLRWLQRRLSAVKVRAPRGVTLSGATGGIGTTVINRLDHPVTVSLKAITDASLQVDTPAAIELAARSSQTVVLDAQATAPGVHYVRLVVTDSDGNALGSSARVPVRSAQVSEVIWVILGVGVGLLFLAIAGRLVKRIRGETR